MNNWTELSVRQLAAQPRVQERELWLVICVGFRILHLVEKKAKDSECSQHLYPVYGKRMRKRSPEDGTARILPMYREGNTKMELRKMKMLVWCGWPQSSWEHREATEATGGGMIFSQGFIKDAVFQRNARNLKSEWSGN